jgi:hypothetical protein
MKVDIEFDHVVIDRVSCIKIVKITGVREKTDLPREYIGTSGSVPVAYYKTYGPASRFWSFKNGSCCEGDEVTSGYSYQLSIQVPEVMKDTIKLYREVIRPYYSTPCSSETPNIDIWVGDVLTQTDFDAIIGMLKIASDRLHTINHAPKRDSVRL